MGVVRRAIGPLHSTAVANGRRVRASDERGAILVHVAVAFVGLLAFSALTVDLGLLWVARTEAQSAADAAALSAAVSLAYVDPADTGVATQAASAIARQHQVWGEPADGALDVDVGPCPTGSPSAPGDCANTVVRRGAGGGTLLPTVFGRLFGLTTQAVRASASAKVMLGNASTCLRPLAVPDSWIDNHDVTLPLDSVWTTTDLFERYADAGPIPPNPDVYIAPTDSSPGSGYTLGASMGVRVRLTRGEIAFSEPARGNMYFQMDLPRAGAPLSPGERYSANIGSCSGVSVAIGSTVPAMDNPWQATIDPADTLIASDPGAFWDGSAIRGSTFAVSPRLIAIALMDPDAYAQQTRPGPSITLTIRNIVGFFLEQTIGDDLEGIVLPMGGMFDDSADDVVQEAAFLRAVTLVR